MDETVVEAGPSLCVGAVAVDDDAILLVRRGHAPQAGCWSVPGGHVRVGETMAEAVVRELHEETGLDAVCESLVGWVERIEGDDHLVIFDFGVTIMGSFEPVAGDDATEARWVPRFELGELELVDGLADFLHDHGVFAGYL
ncbi:MAG: NUDIX hydrolase [Acidimicrobiales bacterium]